MSRAKGNYFEDRAVEYLINRGYIIVERNFYSKFGEIDIVAYADNVYHFIEVKGANDFNPVYAITPSKLSKIIKTINFFMLKRDLQVTYTLDAIIIEGNNLDFIENITI